MNNNGDNDSDDCDSAVPMVQRVNTSKRDDARKRGMFRQRASDKAGAQNRARLSPPDHQWYVLPRRPEEPKRAVDPSWVYDDCAKFESFTIKGWCAFTYRKTVA